VYGGWELIGSRDRRERGVSRGTHWLGWVFDGGRGGGGTLCGPNRRAPSGDSGDWQGPGLNEKTGPAGMRVWQNDCGGARAARGRGHRVFSVLDGKRGGTHRPHRPGPSGGTPRFDLGRPRGRAAEMFQRHWVNAPVPARAWTPGQGPPRTLARDPEPCCGPPAGLYGARWRAGIWRRDWGARRTSPAAEESAQETGPRNLNR